jgi:hypothetical protein
MDKYVCATAGLGWVDGEPKVAVSHGHGVTQYMSPASARFFALQILMIVDQIEPQDHTDDAEIPR